MSRALTTPFCSKALPLATKSVPAPRSHAPLCTEFCAGWSKPVWLAPWLNDPNASPQYPSITSWPLLRKRFETSAKEFEDSVHELDVTPSAPDAFSIRGYTRVLEEAERMIHTAKSRLVISGWPREINELMPEIEKAQKRKVFLVVFSHAALPKIKGAIFSYGLDEAALEEFWKHRLTVVADDVRTLIASTEQSEHDHAVISETAPLAEVATSQIALDITLLSQRTGQDVEKVMAKMLGDRVGRLDTLLSD